MISHALVHTYELSIPILVVIWLTEFPVTTAVLGPVVAVGYALFGIGALPSGVLADQYSTKLLVLVCMIGMGISFLLLSVAQGALTIGIALGVWGVAASIHHPAALSLISTGVKERGTGFAYHGMAGNLGIAFGPLATALLLLFFGWRMTAGLLVVPAVIAAVYAVTAEFDEMAAVSADGGRTTDESTGGVSAFISDTKSLFTTGLALALLVVMMNGLFYRGVLTFLPDVLGSLTSGLIETPQLFEPGSPMAEQFDIASYLYSGLLMIGMLGQYVGGKLTDRIPIAAGLAVTFGGLSVLAVLFVPTVTSGFGPLLAASALLGFLLFTVQPLYQAAIAEQSPPDDRGLSYGYTYLSNFGVGAAGAAAVGYLLTLTDPAGTFLVLAAVPATGAVIAVVLFRITSNN